MGWVRCAVAWLVMVGTCGFAVLVPTAAHAAPFNPAFPTVYIAQGITTQLSAAVQRDGGVAFQGVGPRSTVQYNAIGFRDADRFIYGFANGQGTIPSGNLVQVENDGTVNNLGTVAGITPGPINAGAFLGDDYFAYVSSSLNGGSPTIYKINVATRTATTITLTGGNVTAQDVTATQGFLWGVQYNRNRIIRINPTTGATATFPVADLPPGEYGAAWTYGNGNLAFSNNATGTIYQVALSNPAATPGLEVVSAIPGPPSGQNDGTDSPAAPVDLALQKSVDPAFGQVGDEVTYTLTVTNQGPGSSSGYTINESLPAGLTDVTSADCVVTGSAATCVGGRLAAGDSASFELTGTLEAPFADSVVNEATVIGNELDPNPANDSDEAVVEPVALSLVKDAAVSDVNDNDLTDLGDEIVYSFEVTNTGKGALTDVAVADSLLDDLDIIVTCASTTLAPGDSTTCTAAAAYEITQADVDAGQVTNTATATGTPPAGPPIESEPDTEETPVDQTSDISLDKVVNRDQLVAGDTVTYTFTATNTGTTTLSDVEIAETDFSGSGDISALTCDPEQPSTLPPGLALQCTATYLVTQSDVDAGGLVNTADVTGTAPDGSTLTSDDDAAVPGLPDPGISLDKRVAAVTDVNDNEANDLGDEIAYAFDVTNTGNVTLTGISVADPMLTEAGVAITCSPDPLAPGDTITCTSDTAYTITQADVDDGEVVNTAIATGAPPTGPAVESAPDTEEVTIAQSPSIELEKVVDDDQLTAGDSITYTFTATNTGTTTLTDVEIAETDFSGSGDISALVCEPGQPSTLAPQGTLQCTATYDVTQADVDTGTLVNTAQVTGTPPSGPGVTDDDDAAVPVRPDPGITLDKRVGSLEDVNDNGVTDAGDEIRYVFDLVNTGNVTLTAASVRDQMLDEADISITCDPRTLAPGESVTCEADEPYVITRDDVDDGQVTNTATAIANPPTGPAIVSPSDTVDTPVAGESDVSDGADSTDTPAGDSNGLLPATGGPAWWTAVGGLLAIVVGLTLVVARRRPNR